MELWRWTWYLWPAAASWWSEWLSWQTPPAPSWGCWPAPAGTWSPWPRPSAAPPPPVLDLAWTGTSWGCGDGRAPLRDSPSLQRTEASSWQNNSVERTFLVHLTWWSSGPSATQPRPCEPPECQNGWPGPCCTGGGGCHWRNPPSIWNWTTTIS